MPLFNFTFSPSLSPLALQTPQTLSSKSTPSIAHLMTSAFILRQQPQSPPQILLLRRSPQDSYPLKWEAPGGSADPADASILSAAAREVFEETALTESHFHAVLGMTKQKAEDLFTSSEEQRPGNWGIDPNDEQAQDINVQVSPEMSILFTTFHEPDGIWGKVNFLATATGEDPKVKIDAEEHVEWGWFTEEEVRTGRAARGHVFTEASFAEEMLLLDGEDKRIMEFTSQAVWGSLLEAFRVGREMGIVV